MFFCSYVFILIFLPLLLLFYYIFKNRAYRNIVLLIFSLFFYAWGEPKYVLLLILFIVFNYIIGNILDKKKFNRGILVLGIFIDLLLLIVFKYLDFGIMSLNNIFSININKTNIIVPIGISFYAFQSISYIIDVYNKKVKAEKNIINLGIYISLFPQLLAGPILKYSSIYKDITNRVETIDKFYLGIRRFMIGFCKKVIIANSMAVVCDTVYRYSSPAPMPVLWLAAIAFSLQMYYDFSGYSDMAIGLGKMFGFDFIENFNYPYISKSISEFWKRWHISLNLWFRDYIYIPLGGNRCSKIKWIINILIVFFLTGLWHGANYNYIIWGLYNACFVILEKTVFKNVLNRMNNFLKYIITLIIIIIGMVIFRIEDLKQLSSILINMFNLHNLNFIDYYFNKFDFALSVFYIPIAIIFAFPIANILKRKFSSRYVIMYNVISFILIFIGYLYSLILLMNSSYNYFIYFKF